MKGSLLGLKQKEIGVGLVFHKPHYSKSFHCDRLCFVTLPSDLLRFFLRVAYYGYFLRLFTILQRVSCALLLFVIPD
jgi:hypothetical protein